MIKFVGRNGDRALWGFGLSHENLVRLVADEPILIDSALPPPEGMGIEDGPMVLIMAGKTEQDIAEQLAPAGGFIANPPGPV